MRTFRDHIPHWVKSHSTNLAIFLVLGAVMLLGHHFDWRIPRISAAPVRDDGGSRRATSKAIEPKAEVPTAAPHAIPLRLASAQALAKANIRLAEVRQAGVAEHVRANGTIQYDKTRMAQLSTRAPGIVWEVLAKVGDQVAEGDPLALIESVDVGKAKADFLQAIAQFEHRDKMLRIARKQQGVVAESEILDRESQMREARIQKLNAQQTLINLGLPVILDDFLGLPDKDLTRRLHTLGLPDAWAKKYDPLRTSANLIPLTAPFAGQVIGTDLVKGEAISPGQAKVVITDVRHMWLLMDVALEDAGRLRLGQDVEFAPDGLGANSLRTKVSWISTEADPKTRRVQVRAVAENPAGLLRANAFGSGKIEVRVELSALVVPAEAVHWDFESKSHLVFVRRDAASFDAIPVRVGIRGTSGTEVIPHEPGTLKLGDAIAAQGSYLMKSELLRQRLASASR